jgi:membrane-associated phospholipid phosphatase
MMRALAGRRAGKQVPQVVLAAAILAALSVPRASAQSSLILPEVVEAESTTEGAQQPAPAAPTPRHTGVRAMIKGYGSDMMHLPSKENAFISGFGGGVALAVHPLDDDVSRQVVGNDAVNAFFRPGRIIGAFPVVFGASAGVYAYGRMRDLPTVSHLGMDLLRAIAVSTTVVQPIKYMTRRLRPDGTTKNSFPSGHSADTFAVATALERHLGWKYSIPGYMFASYVAASRLPSNRHWLSDVVFGAAVGVVAGRTVGSHERHNPDPPSITPVTVPGGVAIVYSRTWPR